MFEVISSASSILVPDLPLMCPTSPGPVPAYPNLNLSHYVAYCKNKHCWGLKKYIFRKKNVTATVSDKI